MSLLHFFDTFFRLVINVNLDVNKECLTEWVFYNFVDSEHFFSNLFYLDKDVVDVINHLFNFNQNRFFLILSTVEVSYSSSEVLL